MAAQSAKTSAYKKNERESWNKFSARYTKVAIPEFRPFGRRLIELAGAQLERLRERGLLGELLEMLRARVEPETFAEYEQRGRDLFTQQVCRAKLDLAIEKGLTQENQTVGADAFRQELDQAVLAHADAIRQAIFAELDV